MSAPDPAAPRDIRVLRAWRAVLVIYLYRWVLAAFATVGVGFAVGARVGSDPRGESALYRDEGMLFAELVLNPLPEAGFLGWWALCGVVVAVLCSVVLFSYLVCSLALGGGSVGGRLKRVLSPTLPLVAIAVATRLLQAVVLVATFFGAKAASDPTAWTVVEDEGRIIAYGIGAVLVVVIGVVADACRAQLVRHGEGLYDAVAEGLRLVRRCAPRVFAAYAPRAAAQLAAILLAVVVSFELGAEATYASAFVQGAAVLVVVVARASWVAELLRLSP